MADVSTTTYLPQHFYCGKCRLFPFAENKKIMILKDAIALIQHSDIAGRTNARWADLGCGSGLFTCALANLLQKGGTIDAIDKTITPLQKLPNPHKISIHTKQLDFIKEPLPFNGLDGILMANSFHYVADKMNFIAAAGKTLASDGFFCW